MSIQSEITQLNTNLDNCYAVCEGLGATMPTNKNFDNLQDTIASITRDIDYIIHNGVLVWANPKIYLQSTDNVNTYIDTGLKSQYFSKIETSFKQVNAGICCFLGARDASLVNEIDIRYLYQTTGVNRYKFAINDTSQNYDFIEDYSKRKVVYENGEFFLDGTKVADGFSDTPFTGTYNVALFGMNTTGGIQSAAKKACRLYNVKLYIAGTLVRHFVPVPQGMVIGETTIASNGMFDIANQQFYPCSGAGTLTYGKDE